MHCRKAAGSSIAVALARYLGPEDLHLGTWPEALAHDIGPNARAWKDLLHPAAGASFAVRWARSPARWFDFDHIVAALNGAQRLKYRSVLGHSPEHAHAERVRAFQPAAWRNYFKFCFVRNPYDRAVSDYLWRTRKTGNSRLSFLDFLDRLERRCFDDRTIPRHFDNWPIYAIADRVAVDFVGRFEHLERDLDEVFARLELPRPGLGHEKRMNRSPEYRHWYGARERAIVARLFAPEIEQFGYCF